MLKDMNKKEGFILTVILGMRVESTFFIGVMI